VRSDVLGVVGDILLREGIAELTFERVARLSGVSKTTIYKWWPTPGVLALDGYAHAVEVTLNFPDTGDVRSDLFTQMSAFAHVMTETPGGRILTQLVGQAQTDAELSTAYRALYSAERRRLAVERMQLAQQAGQIREDVDLETVVDQLWGAVYHRLLIPDQPVTGSFIEALLDNILRGIGTR
jgi:AcrR family transcriptional regulator